MLTLSAIVCLLMVITHGCWGISWFGIDNESNRVSRSHTAVCQTLPSSVHVVKEEYSNDGMLTMSCEEQLSVTKCEGTCISKVTPSVVTANGFLKDCQCCREGKLRDREVTLTECYDADGQRLAEKSIKMVVQEPADCGCHKCGD